MIELKQDRARTERLINIAKPNNLDQLRRNPKPPPSVKVPVKIETTKPQAISEKMDTTRYHKYKSFPLACLDKLCRIGGFSFAPYPTKLIKTG